MPMPLTQLQPTLPVGGWNVIGRSLGWFGVMRLSRETSEP